MKTAPANNNNNTSSMTPTNMAPNQVCSENVDCNTNQTTNNDSSNVVDETRQLVTFHNDLNPVIHTFDQPLPLLHDVLSTGSDGNEYSLKSFLERPRRLTVVTWATTDVANATLYTAAVPFDVLNSPIYYEKVKGFMGFRATTIFRVQINATRFQQGRLLVNFLPLGPQAKYDACGFLNYKTQWPKVEFDLSVDTEVILEIPFIHPASYYNLLDGSNTQGFFQLNVYSPLIDVVGATSVKVTIMTEFRDIDLVYPAAPTTLFPQAPDIPVNPRNRRVRAGDRRKPLSKKAPSDVEAEAMGVSSVSSLLSSLAVTSRIASNIPLLSSVAAPVAWATAFVARAAHSFGFSNPLNNAPAKSVIIKPTFAAINSSGVDNSFNLGIFEDNKVETLPGFAGTNLDEMTISYPLSIPTYFTSKTWTTSDVVGTRIDLFYVGPQNFFSPATTATVSGVAGRTVNHFPPCAYFSQLFSKYRGSMRLTFKVVKTEFHTGRLVLAWNPYTADGLTFSNIDFTHKEILDLRISTEFTVTCPWGNPRQYLRVGVPYGYLAMYVLNPLIAPATVSPSVQILCEVSCADDFEFAIPNPTTMMPAFPAFTRPSGFAAISPEVGLDDEELPFEPQAGDIVEGTAKASVHLVASDKPIGSSNLSDVTIAPSKYCIGERIVSFRQLLKRSVPFLSMFWTSTANLTDILTVDPWCVGVANGLSASSTYGLLPDYFSFIGVTYSMMRGSIRIKRMCLMGETETQSGCITVNDWFGNIQPMAISTTVSHISLNKQFIHPIVPYNNLYHNYEVQVPYYNGTHASIVTPIAPGTLRGWNYNDVPPSFITVSTTSPRVDRSISLSRQIGEDFDFGFFSGTVPLVTITTGVPADVYYGYF